MENQTVTDKDEKVEVERLEKEKAGLLKDLVDQRKTNRALEARIAQIENSLNSVPEDVPVDVEVQKFTQSPREYIREVVTPFLQETVKPIQEAVTKGIVEKKLERAMRFIAKKKGISVEEAEEKYEKPLHDVCEKRDFFKLDPYEGAISAFEILEAEEKENQKREKDRERVINENRTEPARSSGTQSNKKVWKRSELANFTKSDWDKHLQEVKEAAEEGRVINDLR